MMIGWWWIYCLIITVTYKSSLIAHLTFPGKSATINTFEDLIKAAGWTWGFEPSYGGGWDWLKYNSNPTINEVFEKLEVGYIIFYFCFLNQLLTSLSHLF